MQNTAEWRIALGGKIRIIKNSDRWMYEFKKMCQYIDAVFLLFTSVERLFFIRSYLPFHFYAKFVWLFANFMAQNMTLCTHSIILNSMIANLRWP